MVKIKKITLLLLKSSRHFKTCEKNTKAIQLYKSMLEDHEEEKQVSERQYLEKISMVLEQPDTNFQTPRCN